MIDAQASLNMPFAGTVSFLAFMVVAPVVLIGMRVYLEVYVQRWRQLDAKCHTRRGLRTEASSCAMVATSPKSKCSRNGRNDMAEAAPLARQRSEEFGEEERTLRVELAACYRIFDYLGWTELIYNHISLRIPGSERHFLINPYGLWYKEVTASNLVKINLEGNSVGESARPVNKAGFIIHSAIHEARDDAHCIMHTHSTAGMAVACQKEGLRTDNFYSAILAGRVAYHDFEGITVHPEEKERLVASLSDRNFAILRSHGLLTCGSTVADAFHNMWLLQRACEIQMAADSSGRAVAPVSEEAIAASQQAVQMMMQDRAYGRLEFEALIREIDRIDDTYKD